MRLQSCLSLALLLGGASCGGGPTPATASSAGGEGSGSSGSSSGSSSLSASGPQTPATTGSTSQANGSTFDPTDDETGRETRGAGTSNGSSSSGGSSCGGSCGDGIVACGEECDCGAEPCPPEGLGFSTCVGMVDLLNPDHVFTGGSLGCNAANCRFDLSACEWGCGDGILVEGESCEPELDSPSCADLGLGDSTDPVPCDKACLLDTSMCL